jgi:hypothetical protein
LHSDTQPGNLPDAHDGVVAGADDLLAVRRECHAVDVLRIAFEHARRAAGERPQADRVIPGSGSERLAVGRDSETDDRASVAIENRVRRRLTRHPDGDARVGATGSDTAVLQENDGVNGALVKPHHLFGDVALERPPDGRCVETAGDRARSIGRN